MKLKLMIYAENIKEKHMKCVTFTRKTRIQTHIDTIMNYSQYLVTFVYIISNHIFLKKPTSYFFV